MPNISVIIPIYNVSGFIGRCVESLMRQSFRDVEYIFVDDATPDDSIAKLEAVLEKYPERKENVRILHHEKNKGLPAARNTGLAAAGGEFIFHCDSDDFVEPDMLEKMYAAAKENDADIVWCDWYLTFGKSERYMRQPDYGSPMEALKGMLTGKMKYNVWNKLVRRTLYADNSISFPAGYGMGEDMTMMMLFACARKVIYVPEAFYHYVKLNGGAFSQTYSPRHLEELKHNVGRVCGFMVSKFPGELERELGLFKLDVKYPFIISDRKEKYRLWSEWYPEANKFIREKRDVSVRRKILELCALHRRYLALWLYYKLIHKFIYGVIYR